MCDTPSRMPLQQPWRDGFSLTELLIVILVLSIVTMAAVPLIGHALRDARLSQAASDIVAALEYARSRAMVSGTDMRVTFPPDGASVLVERRGLATNLLATGEGELIAASLVEEGSFTRIPHPLERHTNAFVSVTRGPGDLQISQADFEGTNVVVFGVMGAPSATGIVEIVCGGDRKTVRIAGRSGQILVGD